MKIALASDWFMPRIGGLEIQVRDLALELAARGHTVEVITATPGDAFVNGIRVHRLDVGPLMPKKMVAWRPRLLGTVDNVIASGNFDVVHGHSAFSPVALAACRSAHFAGIPTVLTEHSVLAGLGGVIVDLSNWMFGWSAWPDVFSAVSNFVAGEVGKHLGVRVEVLPNGISPSDWVQGEDLAQSRVVSVMRFSARKRPLDFVRAIPKVLRQLPTSLAPVFTLVGDGPERRRVEDEARRLGIGDHLELTGWLDRPALVGVLSQSTVFALPTIREALSIATLEAMSAGLPAVAMAHGGIGDIITNGRDGILARTHDEFSGGIARLVSDHGLRRRMAARAPETAARYSWEYVIGRHLDVYEMARVRRSRRTSSA